MTDLERVARAIYEHEEPKYMEAGMVMTSWDSDSEHMNIIRQFWRGKARAALAELREPSPAVVEAAIEEEMCEPNRLHELGVFSTAERDAYLARALARARHILITAIDAALKEGGGE